MLSSLLQFNVNPQSSGAAKMISVRALGAPGACAQVIMLAFHSADTGWSIATASSQEALYSAQPPITTVLEAPFSLLALLCGAQIHANEHGQNKGQNLEPELHQSRSAKYQWVNNVAQATAQMLTDLNVTPSELHSLDGNLIALHLARDTDHSPYTFLMTSAKALDVYKVLFPEGEVEVPAYFVDPSKPSQQIVRLSEYYNKG